MALLTTPSTPLMIAPKYDLGLALQRLIDRFSRRALSSMGDLP
jgi:hypothetical protein